MSKASKKGRRLLGLTLDSRKPIFEPTTNASWIIYGGAGSGKTTCATMTSIQSLLSATDHALIINDVKDGEIAHQIAGMCRKYKRKFAVIDDSAVLGKRYRYRKKLNPFSNIIRAYNQNSADLMFKIENAVLVLIPEPADDPKNFYFRQCPREFAEFAILVLLRKRSSLLTPGGVAALIGDPEIWNAVIDTEAKEGDMLTGPKARQLQELRDQDPEHYSQHYLAVLSALRQFAPGGPLHEVGFEAKQTIYDLLRQNYIICITQRQANAQRMGVYYNLFLNDIMDAQFTGKCGKTDIIFDEAANTPAKSKIEKVTIERAFGMRTFYLAQSRQDLIRQNGEKLISTLEDNCSIQWLKFANIEEAERVSKAMGEWDNVNYSQSDTDEKAELSRNWQTGRERVRTADQLMNMPDNQQLIFVPGVGYIPCLKVAQNQVAPYCYDLGFNPVEGGILTPDPIVHLHAIFGEE